MNFSHYAGMIAALRVILSQWKTAEAPDIAQLDKKHPVSLLKGSLEGFFIYVYSASTTAKSFFLIVDWITCFICLLMCSPSRMHVHVLKYLFFV